jgi:spore coat polysaccharide biosynthesis protein SpsF
MEERFETAHRVVAIIQARMSSTRLPGKVLKPLGARSALGQVVHQLSHAKRINTIAIATSADASDDVLAEWARAEHLPCFRGSLNDVLARYHHAAWSLGAAPNDAIVRITADCPLIDPAVVDSVIERFVATRAEYCSNVNPPTFPDGLDVEVFTMAALERAYNEAHLTAEREHVTPYIRNHPELFRVENLENAVNYEHFRWTLDTEADYEFLCRVMELLQPTTRANAVNPANAAVHLHDVVAVLEAHPELLDINHALKRNHGMTTSNE